MPTRRDLRVAETEWRRESTIQRSHAPKRTQKRTQKRTLWGLIKGLFS